MNKSMDDLLCGASAAGDLATAEGALQAGADPNASCDTADGRKSALELAQENGRAAVADLLRRWAQGGAV